MSFKFLVSQGSAITHLRGGWKYCHEFYFKFREKIQQFTTVKEF